MEGEEYYYAFHLPFDDRPHGFLPSNVVNQMPWTDDFSISHEIPRTVRLLGAGGGDSTDTAAVCNAALSKLIRRAQEEGVFSKTLGRKAEGEDFRIMGALKYSGDTNHADGDDDNENNKNSRLIQIRRSAAPLFGIANRGAHMTMYVRSPDEESGDEGEKKGLRIWVPRRSRHLVTYPGMLDNTVAGGVRAEESPLECIIHESDEEASLPEAFVSQHVKACGTITYVTRTGSSRRGGGIDQQAKVGGYDADLCVSDVIYVYDLEVPADQAETMIPAPRDDEVEQFYLWDVETVMTAMRNGEFKANTSLVMLDFFIRHGIITDDNEPDYAEIVTRLHRRLPVPLTAHSSLN